MVVAAAVKVLHYVNLHEVLFPEAVKPIFYDTLGTKIVIVLKACFSLTLECQKIMNNKKRVIR